MTRISLTALAVAVGSAGSAFAGAVDRSGQSTEILYELGNYFRLSYGSVSPDVSGTQVIPLPNFGLPAGGSSGDATPSYDQLGAAYKHDFENGFEAAIVYDQPFGARIDYDDADPTYFAQGADAELDTDALTALVKYTFPTNVSVFGGLRYQTLSAEAFIPYVTSPLLVPNPGAPYQAMGDEDSGTGYIVGVGYEIPEIAMRISLTYNSAIEHELDTTETSALGAFTSSTEVETPQSVNLEFQTGIAPDTLLFGGIRWVDWTEFELAPENYATLTGILSGTEVALVSYDEDIWTYSLGIGRAFTDQLSGAVTIAYEPQVGGFASNLGPTDGVFRVGLGGTYKIDNWEFTGGVSYAWIGDTETAARPDLKTTEFEDNTAVAFGMEIAYRF